MSQIEYYFPEALIADLEDLLKLDPSQAEAKSAWMKKAERIRQRLTSYLDLDRSEFTSVPSFLGDGEYLSQHPDSYARASTKIRRCIKSYQDYQRQEHAEQKLKIVKSTQNSIVKKAWWEFWK